jgi:hypothetical protein
MKLFVVGRYKSGEFPNTIWDLEGVFSTEKNAIKACKTENYFYGEITLDKTWTPEENNKVIDGSAEWEVSWPKIDLAYGEADGN